jgi:hypothetical protein
MAKIFQKSVNNINPILFIEPPKNENGFVTIFILRQKNPKVVKYYTVLKRNALM